MVNRRLTIRSSCQLMIIKKRCRRACVTDELITLFKRTGSVIVLSGFFLYIAIAFFGHKVSTNSYHIFRKYLRICIFSGSAYSNVQGKKGIQLWKLRLSFVG